jgi:excinuclease ABC subunit C
MVFPFVQAKPSSKKTFDRLAELAKLPESPGIYRMYNAHNDLIYVGKAKRLKQRVRSYFQKSASHTPKVQAMVAEITHFDYVLTDTEMGALLLEDTLIKKHKPPYNILLRDGKQYPWLVLTDERYPRLLMTRKPHLFGRKPICFGPYPNVGDFYHLLKTLRKQFPLRQRRVPLFKNRPCMNYHVGLCPGPCQEMISEKAYEETIYQLKLFLNGKSDELLQQLEQAMQEASEKLAFEEAAKLRDRVKAISDLNHRHLVVSTDIGLDQDVIGFAMDEGWIAIVEWLQIRGGRLMSSQRREYALGLEESQESVLQTFLLQTYREVMPKELPKSILLPFEISDLELFQAWLSQRRTEQAKLSRLEVKIPKKGEALDRLELAQKNARQGLEQAKLYEQTRQQRDPIKALSQLQESVGLPRLPKRMECYDISHFQGSETVASMVVFTDGVPDKASYRRFKIQCAEGEPNDFESMKEVILRRSRHRHDWPEPDLLVIDGGKGQLSHALESLQAAEWDEVPVISLAKRHEEVYRPGETLPVLLPRESQALFLLQQIRDEAHRFAITFHRERRAKKVFNHPLDGLPGVGPATQQKLRAAFQTWLAITEASPAEIAQTLAVSPKKAESIWKAIQDKRRLMESRESGV